VTGAKEPDRSVTIFRPVRLNSRGSREAKTDCDAAVEAEKRKPTDPRVLGLVPDAGGWYNFSIESYLNASLSWAEDTDMGVSQGLPPEPSWRTFAAFLLCGKIYE